MASPPSNCEKDLRDVWSFGSPGLPDFSSRAPFGYNENEDMEFVVYGVTQEPLEKGGNFSDDPPSILSSPWTAQLVPFDWKPGAKAVTLFENHVFPRDKWAFTSCYSYGRQWYLNTSFEIPWGTVDQLEPPFYAVRVALYNSTEMLGNPDSSKPRSFSAGFYLTQEHYTPWINEGHWGEAPPIPGIDASGKGAVKPPGRGQIAAQGAIGICAGIAIILIVLMSERLLLRFRRRPGARTEMGSWQERMNLAQSPTAAPVNAAEGDGLPENPREDAVTEVVDLSSTTSLETRHYNAIQRATEGTPMIFSSDPSLRKEDSSSLEEATKLIPDQSWKFAVYWLQPTLMILYLAVGVIGATSHHLYYLSLHHGKVYTGDRQQWPVRIGSGLTFLTVAVFNMAVGAAYTQYVWTRLRKKTYSLLGVDQLFALTTDATGLFSQEILLRAKSVVLIAVVAWALPIATTIPPATLAVDNVIVPFVMRTWVPTLMTNVHNSWTIDMSNNRSLYWTPTSWVRQITARTAIDSVIGDIPSPATNMSYGLEFPGPAMKCDYANQAQQGLFEYYYQNQVNQTMEAMITNYNNTADYIIDCNYTIPGLLNASAFIGDGGKTTTACLGQQLVYNAFDPDDLPENSLSPDLNNTEALASTGNSGLQLWIQTAEHNIVCSQGFSHFYATFNWTNGSPNHNVARLNFTRDAADEIGWSNRVMSAVFVSLSDIITGNLTIDSKQHQRLETSGNIMLTGLRGCDEIARNFWINKTIESTPKLTRSASGALGMSASFSTSPWLCRNKTLRAAIEDLSNNITMSLIGLDLTSQNTTETNVLYTPSQLVYTYDPINLILTYVVVGVVSLVAVMFGFAALDENGVAHSLKFSAILDTTRSPELAAITKDCGLGTVPLDKQAEKTKLKFGVLRGVGDRDSHRVGFVLADAD